MVELLELYGARSRARQGCLVIPYPFPGPIRSSACQHRRNGTSPPAPIPRPRTPSPHV